MYNWGYIKSCALAKLDLTEEEAINQNLINTFTYYANEAITQISSIKPNHKFARFVIDDSRVGVQCVMPPDLIAFGDDVNERSYEQNGVTFVEQASDEDFKYLGYNKLMFKKPGTYLISYKARWIDFSSASGIDDDTELEVPFDILDCIPSYIASQCYKIDDLQRAQIFRNEYEMFIARIDDTDYKNTKTFNIGGDW
jgi:hypothetical protein